MSYFVIGSSCGGNWIWKHLTCEVVVGDSDAIHSEVIGGLINYFWCKKFYESISLSFSHLFRNVKDNHVLIRGDCQLAVEKQWLFDSSQLEQHQAKNSLCTFLGMIYIWQQSLICKVADGLTIDGILDNWSKLKPVIMEEWGEERDSLIELFGKVRNEWIEKDLSSWIAANR